MAKLGFICSILLYEGYWMHDCVYKADVKRMNHTFRCGGPSLPLIRTCVCKHRKVPITLVPGVPGGRAQCEPTAPTFPLPPCSGSYCLSQPVVLILGRFAEI